jgi:uncharacterized protein
VTSPDRAPGPVTVVVARAVSGGREDEFHQWAHRLTGAAEVFPGFLGWGLLRPAPGSAVWHVVYRFDSPEHLEAWETSEVRADLLARASGFMETVAVRRLDGMDAWFTPTPPPGAPPRWKTFLMTATVIVVLQTLVSTLLRPLVADWPTLARSVAIIVPVVALMTWVVMPRLSRWLRAWLYRG